MRIFIFLLDKEIDAMMLNKETELFFMKFSEINSNIWI